MDRKSGNKKNVVTREETLREANVAKFSAHQPDDLIYDPKYDMAVSRQGKDRGAIVREGDTDVIFDPDGNGTLPVGSTEHDYISDVCIVTNTGNDIEDIAKHSFVGSVQYMRPLTFSNMDLDWFVQASTVYTGDRFNASRKRESATSDRRWDSAMYPRLLHGGA